MRALITHLHAGWQRQSSVEDLGLGGARLVLDERVAAGDEIAISFTAPALWDPLVMQARVAWVAGAGPPFRVGVAFRHRSADAAFALHELIVSLGYE